MFLPIPSHRELLKKSLIRKWYTQSLKVTLAKQQMRVTISIGMYMKVLLASWLIALLNYYELNYNA